MQIRTRISLIALGVMIPIWMLLIWFNYGLIFTDFHIDKYDNLVAAVVTGLIAFYTFIIIKYFNVVSISNQLVKVNYIIPFFNSTYRVSEIETIEVLLLKSDKELSHKKLIIKFNNQKKIAISDFFISNFEQIENCLDWIINNQEKNIGLMTAEYKKKHSITRVIFDNRQINEKFYISLAILLIINMNNVFFFSKSMNETKNTDAEKYIIYLSIPLSIFLVWNIIKLFKLKKNIIAHFKNNYEI